MSLTPDEVRKVANLARLELTNEEIPQMTQHLSAIVDYMDKLKQVDTENVEPLAHPLPVQNVFREDELKESLSVNEALQNAPQREDDFFGVPPVLD